MKNSIIILLACSILVLGIFANDLGGITGRVIGGCIDTDGKDIYTKGSVQVEGSTLEDSCTDNTIVEFYCENNNLKFLVTACSSCGDGACLQISQPPTQPQYIQIQQPSNSLELNESLGSVIQSITEIDIDALSSGSTGKSTKTSYQQYLRLNNGIPSGKVLFTEDNQNNVGDFLYFQDDTDMFEYELQFDNGWESSLTSNTLSDLKDNELSILGREYTVTDATKNNNDIEIQLLGGSFTDMLEEGESAIYEIDGQDHEFEVLIIEDTIPSTVTFVIDNSPSPQLEEGDIYQFGSTTLGVMNLIINEAGEPGLGDMVQFALGAEHIVLKDDVSNTNFQQSIKVNGNSISNSFVKIQGNAKTNGYEITNIKYRTQADDINGGDVFVPPGQQLSSFLRKPESLIAGIDFIYNGLQKPEASIAKIDPTGTDEYRLEFTNNKNNFYDIPIVANVAGNLRIGGDKEVLHFIEATNNTNYTVNQQDYLIFTTRNNKNGITNVLRYTNIDTSNKQLGFDDPSFGTINAIYAGTEGIDASATLTVSGTSYKVFVGPSPGYALAADLDSDGNVNNAEVNIIIDGGGIIDLGSTQNPNTDFNITLTTDSSSLDNPSTGDEVISISILRNGNNIDLDLPAQQKLMRETSSSKTYGTSLYGVYFEEDDDSTIDELLIEYPRSQVTADVRILFSSQQLSKITKKKVPTCYDNIQNQNEQGIDCGNPCKPCQPPAQPEPAPVLPTPTCVDNIQNQGEVGIDCGGPCPACTPVIPPVEEQPAPKPYGDSFWSRIWYAIKWLFGATS